MEREIGRRFSEDTEMPTVRKDIVPTRPPWILPEDKLRKLQKLQELLTIYE